MSEVPKGFSRDLATLLLFCEQQDRIDPPVESSYPDEGLKEIVYYTHQKNRDYIVCNDGFRFSCQASENHYCSPKKNGLPAKDYKLWEIGYPSKPDHAILPYIEDEDRDATGSVYPYVPTDAVIDLIVKHGGLKCQ